MNFSPQNEQGLLGLVQALKQGMDPSTAYSLFGDIQSQQAQAIADRQQRLSQYTQLLQGAATQGMPYQGAATLAQSLPGPMPPQARQALSQLYPEQNVPVPPEMQPGNNPAWQAGTPMPQQLQNATVGQATSPAYQVNPADQLHQQAQMAQDQQIIASGGTMPTAGQQEQAQFGELVHAITTLQAAGKSPEEIKAKIMSNPSAAALYVQNFQKLVLAFPELAGA
jgi:hypothetical protein